VHDEVFDRTVLRAHVYADADSQAFAVTLANSAASGNRHADSPDIHTDTYQRQQRQTFNNYRISTTSGDCVNMDGATGITFENSNIAGRGVYINGGSDNNVYDSYIHVEGASTGCCDTRDGIFNNLSNGTTIQGNVIAYSESNIE
jgi:hypothetical protein